MGDEDFWSALRALAASSSVVIDRPKGSTHPRTGPLRYPLDYGYLDGTFSGDGQGIDVWMGSLGRRDLTAIVCTVDVEKRDAEIKLLMGCTREEQALVLTMHNRGPQRAVLVTAPAVEQEA